jgi:uncharacterized membrane protein
MVTGTLRAVLWFLGALGVLWLLLGLLMLPIMSRMMGGGGMMMNGGMMDGGMIGMGGMMTMMSLMAVQFIAMLGLIGIFIYLIVDSFRDRSRRSSEPVV